MNASIIESMTAFPTALPIAWVTFGGILIPPAFPLLFENKQRGKNNFQKNS